MNGVEESSVALVEAGPKLQERSTELERAAAAIVVQNEGDFSRAVEFGSQIATAIAEATEKLRPMREATTTAWKQGIDLEKSILGPMENARKRINSVCSAFRTAEKEKARKAEMEQIRLLREKEEKERLERAVAMEEAGFSEMATEMLDRPVAVSAPVSWGPVAPKVKGSATKTNFLYRVVDESQVKDEFWVLDESKIKNIVKSLGMGAVGIVGGIQVWEEESVSVRAQR